MFKIGEVSIKAEKLITATYDSMMKAISIVKDGLHLGDIGSAIQTHVESQGFSVVQDFAGMELDVLFIKNQMFCTMEQKEQEKKLMRYDFYHRAYDKSWDHETKILNDGWTAVTKDKSLSAQFEHTIGVTKDGYEIFTELT